MAGIPRVNQLPPDLRALAEYLHYENRPAAICSREVKSPEETFLYQNHEFDQLDLADKCVRHLIESVRDGKEKQNDAEGKIVAGGRLWTLRAVQQWLVLSSAQEADLELEAGMQLAERIRRSVNSSIHATVGAVSVSAGISIWTEKRGLKDTLHLADRSLYAAKRQGRNRIETSVLQVGHAVGPAITAPRLH